MLRAWMVDKRLDGARSPRLLFPCGGLRQEIAQTHRWRRVDDRVEGFTTAVIFGKPGWPPALRVVVYRKRVSHESRKNFQLDLFTPDDGHCE